MSARSAIEWTDATWNPTVGCSIVSPGCTNCYAMKMAARIERMNPAAVHYKDLTRPSKAGPVWRGVVRWPQPLPDQPLHWKKPRRIFVNSMSDLFHEDVPDEVIDKVFAIMALAPRHTYQVLTKRAERMRTYMSAPGRAFRIDVEADTLSGRHGTDAPFWPLPNVWLGVSVEDQARADERIPHLLATPAAKRFLSCEPLLGKVSLTEIEGGGFKIDALSGHHWRPTQAGDTEEIAECAKIDWVIAGGESGPAARPSHWEWVRTLRDDCVWSDTPFFFKQWGCWAPHSGEMRPFSKKGAGATIDGREWREFPA